MSRIEGPLSYLILYKDLIKVARLRLKILNYVLSLFPLYILPGTMVGGSWLLTASQYPARVNIALQLGRYKGS